MKKLINPIANFDEKVLLGVGLVSVAINIGLGDVFGFKMISILKFTASNLPLSGNALVVLRTFAITIAVFYLLAWVINKRTRPIDIVNTFLIGIIPSLVIAPLSYIPYFKETLSQVIENPNAIDANVLTKLLLLAVVSIPFVVYSIILYYNGFKTATNMKMGYHIVLFALALLIVPTLIQLI